MLEITVCVVKGVTVVHLEGPLVRGQADGLVEIVEWLQEFGERRITVHAAAVTVADTHGLSALVHCHAALGLVGGRLLVRDPSPRLRVALGRTGIDTVVPILDERHAQRAGSPRNLAGATVAGRGRAPL